MILVTAATGNVGRPLLDLLVQSGARVRAVTRDATGVGLPAGVEVVEGDPSKPGTTAAALSGVSSVFVNPRAVGRGIEQLVEMAREVGVGRLVALSALNVDDDPARQPSRYRGDLNWETEAAVAGWGGEWVSLRPSVFASNTIGLWGAQVRAGNAIRGPAGRASSAPIDERDLAGVAAQAGVRRLIVISAAPVATVASPQRPHPPRHDPGEGPLTRSLLTPLIRAIFGANYADLARMEDAVAASDLDWTIVRAPRLTTGPLTGRYRTEMDRDVRGGRQISRADLAHLMLELPGQPHTVEHTIGVAY